jgi:Flp pilus assembly protein protease CpaA
MSANAMTLRALPPRVRVWGLALVLPGLVMIPWLALAREFGVKGILGTAAGMVLALLLVTTAVTDLCWRRIFNWATYSAVLWALLLSLVGWGVPEQYEVTRPSLSWLLRATATPPPAEPLQSVLGVRAFGDTVAELGCCLVLVGVVYAASGGLGTGRRYIAAGDLKLLAAVAVLLGLPLGLWACVYSCIFAAIFAACYLAWRIGPVGVLALLLYLCGAWRLARWLKCDSPPNIGVLLQRQLPMAPFVAAGTLASVI